MTNKLSESPEPMTVLEVGGLDLQIIEEPNFRLDSLGPTFKINVTFTINESMEGCGYIFRLTSSKNRYADYPRLKICQPSQFNDNQWTMRVKYNFDADPVNENKRKISHYVRNFNKKHLGKPFNMIIQQVQIEDELRLQVFSGPNHKLVIDDDRIVPVVKDVDVWVSEFTGSKYEKEAASGIMNSLSITTPFNEM